MRVYLIRHATAAAPGSGSDGERALTDDGLREAQACGRALKALGARLRAILASPLLRACQTAQEIASRLDPSPAVEIREALAAGAGPRQYFEALQGWEDGEVAVVGHMPDLGRVAAVLLSGAPEVSVVFKPSAVCCLDVDVANETGTLVWFHGPEKLAELAE